MDDNKTSKEEFEKELDKKELDYYINYNDRKNPFILILLVTFVFLLALGLSFSAINFLLEDQTLISSVIKDEDKTKYIITYAETSSIVKNGIYLANQFPTKDEVGKLFTGENYVYEFSLLVGEKTEGVYYELSAITDTSNTLDPSYVKLYLQKNGSDVEFSYKPDNKVKVFTDYKDSEYSEVSGKVIYQGEVSESDVKNGKIDFVMRMWVSEDAPYDESIFNKAFSVNVNTYAWSEK